MIARFSKIITLLTLVLFPFSALAYEVGVPIPGKGTSFSSYVDYLGSVFSFALKAGAVLTTLMFIYAGYKYITSQGNPTAINEAKDIIVGALSGFILLLFVYFILKFLNLPVS